MRERADLLARKITPDIDDPFNVAMLTEGDLDDAGRLEGELTAISMLGGRRLVRLRLTGDRAGPDKAAAEALAAHADGKLNPDAFFLVEAGGLGRDSALRKAAEKAPGCACIPCYEDEHGDVARIVREALVADRSAWTPRPWSCSSLACPRSAASPARRSSAWPCGSAPAAAAPPPPPISRNSWASSRSPPWPRPPNDAFGGRLAAAQAGPAPRRRRGRDRPPAVRAMGMHLARLRRTLTLAANGAGLQEAAKASGVFWKTEREFLRQARAWSWTPSRPSSPKSSMPTGPASRPVPPITSSPSAWP